MASDMAGGKDGVYVIFVKQGFQFFSLSSAGNSLPSATVLLQAMTK